MADWTAAATMAFEENREAHCIVATLRPDGEEPMIFGTILSTVRLGSPALFEQWLELMQEIAKAWMADNLGAHSFHTRVLKPGEMN